VGGVLVPARATRAKTDDSALPHPLNSDVRPPLAIRPSIEAVWQRRQFWRKADATRAALSRPDAERQNVDAALGRAIRRPSQAEVDE
jgi:hypothetical protein